jgi:hypothetical protein
MPVRLDRGLVVVAFLANVSCANASAPAPLVPTKPLPASPRTWTVTYRWQWQAHSDADRELGDDSHNDGASAPRCSHLVISEQVVDGDEIVGTIIDGDDPSCGVGTRIRVKTGLDEQVDVSEDPSLDQMTSERVQALHQHLRHPRAAPSLRRTTQWDVPVTHTTENGIEYLDTVLGDSEKIHGMWDRGREITIRIREREVDHALACATYEDDTHGVGEYGGFSGSHGEVIQVDYGDGTPPCPR